MEQEINENNKKQVAEEIKELIAKLNIGLRLASEIKLTVRITQPEVYPYVGNAAVLCHISETIDY